MMDDAKNMLTPKLRFPEFRDGAKWQSYLLERLEDLGWVELGRGDVISNQDIKSIPGEFPIYSSSVKNNGYMGSYGRFMFDEELISWSVDGGGDFFHRPKHKFSVTNVSGYMRLDTSRLSYRFVASHLQALHAALTFDYQLKAHPSVIRKVYRLSIPSVAEQQKIAECLSTLDERIGAESQKLDALKAHKKGLMQQLFPREGETLPRLRFPEFQDAPEWEEKEVGEVFSVTRGQVLAMPLVSESKTSEAPYPVYSSQTKRAGLCGFYSDFLFEDAITWTTDGANAGDVNFRSGKFYCTNVCGVLLNSEGFANPCIAALINSVSRNHVSYVGNPKLMNGVMAKIVIPFPSVVEQHRIASCLSSLDDLIAAQSDQLEAIKTHKKGLMQQLFPAPVEIEP